MIRKVLLLSLLLTACGEDRPRPNPSTPRDGSVARDDATATVDGGLVLGFDAGLMDSGRFDGGINCTEGQSACTSIMQGCLTSATDQPANEACWRDFGVCRSDDYDLAATCYEADGDPEHAAYSRCCGDCAKNRADCRAPFAFTAPNATTDGCDARGSMCREACGIPACEPDAF